MNTDDAQIAFPLLIGDIGGTNARFQILKDRVSEPISFPNLLTANHPTIEQAIQSGILDKTEVKPKAALIAAAGPIENQSLDLTNHNWTIKPDGFLNKLKIEELALLNDFEAQALATISFKPGDIIKLGNGEPIDNSNRVIVGPGTGLGVSGLISNQNTWIPVPSEGGHVSTGPQSKEDFSIWQHFDNGSGRVSAEQIISGRGIVNIYNAVSLARGRKQELTSPEAITAAALKAKDDLAVKTIELFCRYLGRVAGDLALTYLARGGVYIAGGIGKHILPILAESQFRSEFENKHPHSDLMRSIPTYLIIHENAALSGLAAFARNQSSFGIDTKGRHWRV